MDGWIFGVHLRRYKQIEMLLFCISVSKGNNLKSQFKEIHICLDAGFLINSSKKVVLICCCGTV